jgi:hypothetical protein
MVRHPPPTMRPLLPDCRIKLAGRGRWRGPLGDSQGIDTGPADATERRPRSGFLEDPMDEDLAGMSREQLIEEIRKLRRGIRAHRDSTGHELCWHHPALWGLLPEKQDPLPMVPEWPEFIRGCVRYRQSLDEQAPNAPRSSQPDDR